MRGPSYMGGNGFARAPTSVIFGDRIEGPATSQPLAGLFISIPQVVTMTVFAALLSLFAFLHTAKEPDVSMIVVAPAETLSVTHRGTGTAVVIIPGMLGGAYSFRKVTAELSESYGRVLVIDPLGTGGSSRPRDANYSMQSQAVRIAAVLDSMDIKRAVVVGHTAGVPIALRLALLRPQLVSGVVAINGNASEKFEAGNVRMAVRLAPIIKLFGGKKKAEKRVVGGMKEHSADTTWITPDVVASYTEPYRKDLTGTLRVLDAVSRSKEPWPLLPKLGELRAPVTLLIGSGAPKQLGKPEDLAAFRAALPSMRVDSIGNAGAFVQEERPGVLVAAIRSVARN